MSGVCVCWKESHAEDGLLAHGGRTVGMRVVAFWGPFPIEMSLQVGVGRENSEQRVSLVNEGFS